MNQSARYVRLVEWSDEDQCFVGSCPELFYGGCHGDDPRQVFDVLCQLVEETLEVYQREGKSLPKPLSGRDFVNAMQRIA
jgi:predicted RNase H-like HicB family nuclease